MPYNTRRKSLSLPSLGIHIPMTSAARAEAASRSSGRLSTSSASSSASRRSLSRSHSPESHPSKRLKKSHSAPSADSSAIEQTPPPSPTPASADLDDAQDAPTKIDLTTVKDDIVEGVITQLQDTSNRPIIIKDLATILGQSLTSVQQSANPCAIISSRLGSYMKRPCWTADNICPLAKELETAHPRRTYYYLTTLPRQPLPSAAEAAQAQTTRVGDLTPSVSLTDDSGSDELEERRRELSPSPELDLPRPDFYEADDFDMPMSPIGALPRTRPRNVNYVPYSLPPLEKDEREFTQTADTLQKRKWNPEPPASTESAADRYPMGDYYGSRDDFWLGDNFNAGFLTSPAVKPAFNPYSSHKDDDADNWLKLHKLFEWDQGAESIEIDELDGLLADC